MIRGLDRRLRKLESIGRRIKRSEAGSPGEFESLSDDQLDRGIRQRLVQLGIMSDSDTPHHTCPVSRKSLASIAAPVEIESLSDDELERAVRQRAVALGFMSNGDT